MLEQNKHYLEVFMERQLWLWGILFLCFTPTQVLAQNVQTTDLGGTPNTNTNTPTNIPQQQIQCFEATNANEFYQVAIVPMLKDGLHRRNSSLNDYAIFLKNDDKSAQANLVNNDLEAQAINYMYGQSCNHQFGIGDFVYTENVKNDNNLFEDVYFLKNTKDYNQQYMRLFDQIEEE